MDPNPARDVQDPTPVEEARPGPFDPVFNPNRANKRALGATSARTRKAAARTRRAEAQAHERLARAVVRLDARIREARND